jgi:hypothetical protein
MGAWGTGILHNDTTVDIWTEFKEMYSNGNSIKEIRQKLEKEYKPEKDKEYYSEIWTGIAYGQWMCGELEEYTLEKVKAATNEKWLPLWAEDKKSLQKRIKALSEFITKIQTPRPTPLKRKKIVIRQAFFQAGDVIGIEINPEQYVAAIVTKQKDYGNDGENTIVFTDCFFSREISVDDVCKANIFYLDIGGTNNYYRGYFEAIFSARNMAKKISLTHKIGAIEQDEYLWLGVGTPIGDWNKVSELYNEQLAFLNNHKSDRPLNVSVHQFLKRDAKLEAQLIEWDKKIFREKLKPQNAV